MNFEDDPFDTDFASGEAFASFLDDIADDGFDFPPFEDGLPSEMAVLHSHAWPEEASTPSVEAPLAVTVTDPTPSQSTKDSVKLEAIRKKNRKAQEKYRQKKKAEQVMMDTQVATMRQSLEDAKRDATARSALNSDLMHRINCAQVQIDTLQQVPLDLSPVETSIQQVPPSPPHTTSSHSSALSCSPPPPSSASSLFTSPSSAPREMSSFLHHVPISYALLEAHCTSNSQSFKFSPLATSVTQYKDAEAAKLKCAPTDICWTISSTRIPRLGGISTHIGSPSCRIRMFYQWLHYTTDVAVHVALIAYLKPFSTDVYNVTASGDDGICSLTGSSTPPSHAPHSDAPSFHSHVPTPTDNSFTAGHPGMITAHAEELTEELLLPHLSKLPAGDAKSLVNALLSIVDNLASRPAEFAGVHSVDESDRSAASHLEDNSAVLIGFATAVKRLASVHQAHDAPHPTCRQAKLELERLDKEIMIADANSNLMLHIFMVDSPRVFYTLALQTCCPGALAFMTFEKIHSECYQAMSLSTKQKAVMATVWQSYKDHMQQLAVTQRGLLDRLRDVGDPSDINVAFLRKLMSCVSKTHSPHPAPCEPTWMYKFAGVSHTSVETCVEVLDALRSLQMSRLALYSDLVEGATRQALSCQQRSIHMTYCLPVVADIFKLCDLAANDLKHSQAFNGSENSLKITQPTAWVVNEAAYLKRPLHGLWNDVLGVSTEQ